LLSLLINQKQLYNDNTSNWKRWQLVMNCQLTPHNIAPVILGFNYEAHNASASTYKSDNYTASADW